MLPPTGNRTARGLAQAAAETAGDVSWREGEALHRWNRITEAITTDVAHWCAIKEGSSEPEAGPV
ncbi:hypothetical protein PR003_g30645 [Phytophthora rubi]|uniref:Uncharacterized protein n=1 Tax=Phytophthora rubi TaxID=129364 RepID=A0A6A4BHJ2_9STRA|nr:hypothetical protein PR003_g30645 [Phytophthora rubi]